MGSALYKQGSNASCVLQQDRTEQAAIGSLFKVLQIARCKEYCSRTISIVEVAELTGLGWLLLKLKSED